jgi:hypothetical protein
MNFSAKVLHFFYITCFSFRFLSSFTQNERILKGTIYFLTPPRQFFGSGTSLAFLTFSLKDFVLFLLLARHSPSELGLCSCFVRRLSYGKGCNTERLRRSRELPVAATQIEGCTYCATPSKFRTARFAPLTTNPPNQRTPTKSLSKNSKNQRRPAARSGAALN